MSREWIAPMEWNAEGAEPSTTLKANGFQGGYKPPAGIFNYAFHKYQKCFEELQAAIDEDNQAQADHIAEKIISETGVHGLRFYNGNTFEYKGLDNEWHKFDKAGRTLANELVQPYVDSDPIQAGIAAEIFNDINDREYSDVDGSILYGNVASGDYSHAEGICTTATGSASHAEGDGTLASGERSHAEGRGTVASGDNSHANGFKTTASGSTSFAIGNQTKAIGAFSFSAGEKSEAQGETSFAAGYINKATGSYSFVAGAFNESRAFQTVFGRHNTPMNATSLTDQSANTTLFMIGYGISGTTGNAFRVRADGKCMGVQAFGASGADYAEYFEWLDGNPNNEDRRGLFVALDGEKIKLANDGDFIIGVVSAAPCFVGNSQSEEWIGKYQLDVFGQRIVNTVEVPETTDEQGNIIPAHTEDRFVLNPNYNPDLEYQCREFRKEWSPVGLVGQLIMVDDGTCEVNGYCKPSKNGIGTKSTETTSYRVMKRIDETHIKIYIK